MSSTSGEVDERIARYTAQINGDREVLRRKVGRLLREFNGGDTTIHFGPLSYDIVAEFERRLRTLSDGQVKHALDILRE